MQHSAFCPNLRFRDLMSAVSSNHKTLPIHTSNESEIIVLTDIR